MIYYPKTNVDKWNNFLINALTDEVQTDAGKHAWKSIVKERFNTWISSKTRYVLNPNDTISKAGRHCALQTVKGASCEICGDDGTTYFDLLNELVDTHLSSLLEKTLSSYPEIKNELRKEYIYSDENLISTADITSFLSTTPGCAAAYERWYEFEKEVTKNLILEAREVCL